MLFLRCNGGQSAVFFSTRVLKFSIGLYAESCCCKGFLALNSCEYMNSV